MGNRPTKENVDGQNRAAGKVRRIERLTRYLTKCDKLSSEVINLSYFQLPNINEIVNEVAQKNSINTANWKEFKLDLNGIQDLSSNIFLLCQNLTVLTLRYNKINAIPEELCNNCPNLRVLNISNNPLSNGIPDNIDNLRNLEQLFCCNTIMKDVTPALGNCFNLVVLDLFNCNIVELAPELGKLSNLRRLDVANNYITSLPEKFLKLTNLQYLNLNNNNISSLPTNFGDAVSKSLKELHMARTGVDDGCVVEDDDHIHNLIDELAKMKALVKLDLSRNKLSKVPAKFSNVSAFPSLRRLNLSYNPLVIINSRFEDDDLLTLKDRLDVVVIDINSQNFHNKMAPSTSQSDVPKLTRAGRTISREDTAILSTSPGTSSVFLSSSASLNEREHGTHNNVFKKAVLDYDSFISKDHNTNDYTVRFRLPTKLGSEQLRDRIKGCIFGAAVGDAIGLATEFLSKIEAQFHYYDQPIEYSTFIRDRHRSAFTPGDWTDDTDQMIVIIDCILNNNEYEEDIINKSGNPLITQVQFAAGLQKWCKTGFRDELGDTVGPGIDQNVLAVLTHPQFIDNPEKVAQEAGKSEHAANNGALMRSAVLGIPFFYDLEKVVDHTKTVCKTTHSDERCIASCIALSTAIALLLRGEDLPPLNPYTTMKRTAPIHYIIQQSLAIAKSATKDPVNLQALEDAVMCKNFRKLRLEEENSRGQTFKTLGAAFSCFYEQARDDLSFKEIITNVIMEGGDADSNSCSAGALIGARIGYSQLPEDWLNNLIHKEWLENKVDKFLKILGL
eukprot:TRINITY_DN1476_c0_g1_i1.p1 TRINITY_DN1476_c0_g1~~TRINITY_DN1476_c0_g1_i1.p1  ORF type:complete len:786 (+),score=280.57 TRINITY_DN1476_c0_g1_i1:301-2658(+)